MIVPEDKNSSVRQVGATHPDTPDVPPPCYSSSEPLAASTSSAPRPKPTNFLHIVQEHQPIEGHYYIDPSLRIPAALLPPLSSKEPDEERKNVFVKAVHRKIDLDLTLVKDNVSSEAKVNPPKPVTITLQGVHGSVNARINDNRPPEFRSPLRVDVTGDSSTLVLHLPRSFTGPLRVKSSYSSVEFSDAMRREITTITGDTHFVGDLSTCRDDESWEGDEASLTTTHGKIWVGYVGEERYQGKSAFRRMLGF